MALKNYGFRDNIIERRQLGNGALDWVCAVLCHQASGCKAWTINRATKFCVLHSKGELAYETNYEELGWNCDGKKLFTSFTRQL